MAMSEELPYKTAGVPPPSMQQPLTSSSSLTTSGGALMMASNNNLGMDKSTLKVHLPDGSFNVVRFGDATDIKVCSFYSGVLKFFLIFHFGSSSY